MRKTLVFSIIAAITVASLPNKNARADDQVVELRLELTSPRMTLLDVDESGMVGTPDGHVTFIRENGHIRMWAPINGGTVELGTTDFLDVHALTDPAQEVLSPRGTGFDSEYAGGSKVLRLPNGDLAMIYHGESHPCTGANAVVAIGLAVSSDDGATWQRRGKILTAAPYEFQSCEGRNFYGSGSFSGVVSPDGKYLYLYHHIWHPEQSCYVTVARSEIASGLGPGTWVRYYNGEWSQPGLGGLGGDMWHESSQDPTSTCMAGIPSVSWNPTFNMWLVVFVSFTGFWYASSPDGLHWSDARLLLPHITLVAPESLIDHEQYIYYPSLIDTHADQDGRTNINSLLIYAFGGWTSAHHMVANTVKISAITRPVLPPTGSDLTFLLVWVTALMTFGALAVLIRTRSARIPLGAP